MPTYELVPGQGIPPIRFGMTPAEVRQVMGEPDRGSGPGGHAVLGAWEFGALLVNTDENFRVDYLEVSCLPDTRVVYKGISIFEVPASEAAMAVCGGQPQTSSSAQISRPTWDFRAATGTTGTQSDRKRLARPDLLGA